MTILVTGGAGFIGSHVAAALLRAGHRVVCLDDLSGGDRDNLPGGAVFVEGSIVDHRLIDRLFDEHAFSHVFHLAAYAAEGLSHFIRRFNYTNNLIGSVNLINAAVRSKVKRFVFTSSIAVYGHGSGSGRFTEQEAPVPADPYGVAKLAVEQDLHAAHDMFGLDYTIFRPHNVYGEHQNIGDRYRNVVGIFMSQLLRGEPMTVFGDGEQSREFTYIDDVARDVARCIDLPQTRNRIYNIGADDAVTVNFLAERVAAAFEAECTIEHLQARNEVDHALADHSQFKRDFGDTPCTPLDEGLARMAAWVRDRGARTSPHFEGIELTENLPPSWVRR